MAVTDQSLLTPDWAAPSQVRAAATGRRGGHSSGGYGSLNLALHVGDEPGSVQKNRAVLASLLDLPGEPCWLDQVHGAQVVNADSGGRARAADAAWSAVPGTVCAVLTADCLPVLLCDRSGTMVAAVHAGWRGQCAGVLERSVGEFIRAGIAADQVLAWLGPAIGPAAYEVDEPVRAAFLKRLPGCADSFAVSRAGHWQLDLYAAARTLLAAAGVTAVTGGRLCTFSDEQFYSYRREPVCGRQAALIWLANE
jgi:YfiH family protein